MKNILILNGAARCNGNTAELVKAFCEGAAKNGNEIREFYLQDMNIRGCLGCSVCYHNGGTCSQKDDMSQIYDAFFSANVIVFATPIYFGGITGTLKTANDRLFAMWNNQETMKRKRQSVLLVTAGAPSSFEAPLRWYSQFSLYSKWEDLGTVLGAGSGQGLKKVYDLENVEKARKIGESIQ